MSDNELRDTATSFDAAQRLFHADSSAATTRASCVHEPDSEVC
jgi:hypothetical protein